MCTSGNKIHMYLTRWAVLRERSRRFIYILIFFLISCFLCIFSTITFNWWIVTYPGSFGTSAGDPETKSWFWCSIIFFLFNYFIYKNIKTKQNNHSIFFTLQGNSLLFFFFYIIFHYNIYLLGSIYVYLNYRFFYFHLNFSN